MCLRNTKEAKVSTKIRLCGIYKQIINQRILLRYHVRRASRNSPFFNFWIRVQTSSTSLSPLRLNNCIRLERLHTTAVKFSTNFIVCSAFAILDRFWRPVVNRFHSSLISISSNRTIFLLNFYENHIAFEKLS